MQLAESVHHSFQFWPCTEFKKDTSRFEWCWIQQVASCDAAFTIQQLNIADSMDCLFGTCDNKQRKNFFFYTFQGRKFFASLWSAKLFFHSFERERIIFLQRLYSPPPPQNQMVRPLKMSFKVKFCS